MIIIRELRPGIYQLCFSVFNYRLEERFSRRLIEHEQVVLGHMLPIAL